MTTYNWYCPECGAEDYGIPEDPEVAPRCKHCEVDMCKLEPADDEEIEKDEEE